MATETDNSIEALLEQRAQFEQWLAKLDAAADKAPQSVRQKVRADYEVRLRGVIERLRSHAATIADELQRHRTTQGELDAQRRQAEDELAEAEVRHTVGEFGEDEWRRISHESDNRLNGLRDQLKSVGNEIARLAEVQALIAAPGRAHCRSAATSEARRQAVAETPRA
jgi:chromosome segregation ATPase